MAEDLSLGEYADHYDYNTPGYPTFEPYGGPGDMLRVIYNVQLFLFLPVGIVLSLILFIKIVGNGKLRGDPWRWLIAQRCFLVIILIIIHFNELVTENYNLPSLMTTVLCPAVSTVRPVIWFMTIVSSTLLVTERFRALHIGNENEGGMSKKAVIISLVVFWVLLGLLIFVSIPVKAALTGFSPYSTFGQGYQLCYLKNREIVMPSMILLSLWSLITYFVGIIGVCVYGNRKSTSDGMKQSIVAPTVAVSIFGLLFDSLPMLLTAIVYFPIFLMLPALNDVAFPIIWLVTWSRNGDISWNKKNNDENKRLLDQK